MIFTSDEVTSENHWQIASLMHYSLFLFQNLALPRDADYFIYQYEKCAIDFLTEYDNGNIQPNIELKVVMLNDNFTTSEISAPIGSLKNDKSPGLDCIPSEFIKVYQYELLDVPSVALNCIIDFPDSWAEGLGLPVFRSGRMNECQNFRGITVLSVFAKTFETALFNGLVFTNEAFF